ncbi:MAG TPA: LLM class flavin-dependent oxidoreductase [Thermomicrobiales bacterium]|nr:LLM class flavin-dependent oxidoreductase [Thermomicrobiales bacterium]
MKHGLTAPNFGTFGDITRLVEFTREADAAGWDGFFLWDHLQTIDLPPDGPVIDPWIAMAAIASQTERLRLGAMVTPLSRRRPWKVARETVTLDHLSNGRLIVGAGIGGDYYREFSGFGEPVGDRLHAAKLDEALEILDRLWTGESVTFDGEHYHLENITFNPTPVQQPRIPIWLAGIWPGTKPFQRAAKWDGIFPLYRPDGVFPPEEIRAMVDYIRRFRTSEAPFDVVISTKSHEPGKTDPLPSDEYLSELAALEDAGVTWSMQGLHLAASIDEVLAVIRQGPPQVDRPRG